MRWTIPLILLLACSSSSSDGSSGSTSSSSGSTSSSSSSSSGGKTDSGTSGGTDAGNDAGPVSNCTTFVDRSAASASRVETWDFMLYTRPERCMKIKVTQTVRFTSDGTNPADFSARPIAPNGGDSPSPFATFDTSTGEVAFPKAGTFGYSNPDAPAMLGAIDVTQ